MASLPFALRRPWLLVRDLLVDRERPDLSALAAIRDPERFVWAILPHAARTFSACIALLPAASARASAVAYLYCRILDTYEDLSPGPGAQRAALSAFAARLRPWRSAPDAAAARPAEDTGPGAGASSRPPALPPPPPLDDAFARDARDRAHVLLVQRCAHVDRVFLTLPPAVQAIVAELVEDMAAGMAEGAAAFAEGGGVLSAQPALLRYCRAVLGNPVLFVTRLTRLRRSGSPALAAHEREAALAAGEFIQLANVTRDVEKDLARRVAFHPLLAGDLGAVAPRGRDDALDADDHALLDRIVRARGELLDLALARAPRYADLMAALDNGSPSLTRASALLMLLFTERHYAAMAARLRRGPPPARRGALSLVLAVLPAIVSRRAAERRTSAALAQLSSLAGDEPVW